jgi:hypothetical protein
MQYPQFPQDPSQVYLDDHSYTPFMKTSRFVAIVALLLGATRVYAQTATQVVTFQVVAINQIAVAGLPSLTINTAVAGSNPTSASSAVATWAVTTNQSSAKITASLDANMPVGLTLSAALAAPAGATSAGAISLSTTAADVVTGITKLAAGLLAITYTLDATPVAGVVASQSRTVTYTITGGT